MTRMYTVELGDGDQREPYSTVLQTTDVEQVVALVRKLIERPRQFYPVKVQGRDLVDRQADLLK